MNRDEFKINDEVWDIFYGFGIVVNVVKGKPYSVVVKFKDGDYVNSYTKEGECCSNRKRTLFFEEIIIPESAYKRPRWRAKSGDIYCHISGTGLIMHIAEFDNFDNNAHYKVGNYFKTEEEAKESKFYKVFHEEE